MTNYKNIFGKPVKFLATDPDNAEAEGQIWYNSTSDAFKSVLVNEAWSSASNMINARYTIDPGIGASQSDAIGAGGYGTTSLTEEYNGSGWSNGGNLNTARYYGVGGGIQTAAWIAGGVGFPPNAIIADTENYDGSAWTASGSLPTATRNAAATGLQTAGLLFGGNTPTPPAVVDATYEYDGSTWTANPTGLNTARRSLGSAGTQTSALAFGGDLGPPSSSDATEEYDGSTWTSANNLPGFQRAAGSGGTQTSAIYMGGDLRPSGVALGTRTVIYDGTNWTTTANMGTGRYELGGAAANNSAAVAFGGYITAATSLTEEYNKSTTVFTPAAWASGPAINTARSSFNNGLGPTSASLIFGGNPGAAPYTTNATEEYDGSSWTAGGNYPSSNTAVTGAAGTQTAALGFASSDSPTSIVTNYDGTTWTVNPASFPAGYGGTGTGESSSAIYAGYSGTNSLEWDNTSWTAGGTMNTSRTGFGTGFGNASSAIQATGSTSPSTLTNDSEEYNGTSWTSVGNVNTSRKRLAASRAFSNASGYIFGGTPATNNSGPTFNNTELWNGTNWSTAPNLGAGIGNQFGAGTTDAFSIGGDTSPGLTTATEIFNPETTALNLKTLTTS